MTTASRSLYRRASPPIEADTLIAFAAFRYALGRQTYIVGHIASWLIANRAALLADDRVTWRRVRKVFTQAPSLPDPDDTQGGAL